MDAQKGGYEMWVYKKVARKKEYKLIWGLKKKDYIEAYRAMACMRTDGRKTDKTGSQCDFRENPWKNMKDYRSYRGGTNNLAIELGQKK